MKSNKLELLTTKIGSGVTPRGGASVYQNSGVCLIRSQNIYNNRFEMKGIVCISEEIATKMKSVEVMKDDVLINITGDSVTRTYLVPDEILPARVNQHVCILRTKPELNPHYLYYFLINPVTQNHLLSISGIGGTRNALTKDMLSNLIVEYPDYQTQEKIITQLNTIKNKIIILEKENKILEQIAQTIFKSWFVDFIGVTEWLDSELGPIPNNWKVEKIGNILKTASGGTPSKNISSYWNDGTVSWINSSKVRNFRIITPESLITEDALNNSSTKLIPKKTTVMAITGATLGQISILEIDSCISQNVVAIYENEIISNEYVYLWIKHIIEDIMAWQSGGAQQHINKGVIDQSPILVPSDDVMKNFKNLTRPIFEIISSNSFEIMNVKKIRDVLLPKLMSGEIIV